MTVFAIDVFVFAFQGKVGFVMVKPGFAPGFGVVAVFALFAV